MIFTYMWIDSGSIWSHFRGTISRLNLLLAFILLLFSQVGATSTAPNPNSPEGITITQPSGSTAIGEAPDYWTQVWGAPLVMNDPLGIRQLDSPKCVYPNHFDDNLSWCSAGLWCGQVISSVSDPDLYLLHPGYDNDLPQGILGELHPIDANYYRQITFRMYIDSVAPGDPGFQVVWTNGNVGDFGNPPKWGQTIFYKTYPGWNIYTIDLGLYITGSLPFPGALPWAGNITGLRLDPGNSGMNNKIVELNWVRLTPVQNLQLSWTTNQSGPLTIALQTSGVNDTLRQYTIVSNYSTPLYIQANTGSFTLPLSLPGGDWTVQISAAGQTSAAAGPWVVQALPQARFVHPGVNTGEDYATSVLHRPWDMSGLQSIYSYENMTAPTFGNNILSSSTIAIPSAVCTSGPWADPRINLLNDNYRSPPITTDPPIDTAKYHFLTAYVKLDGTPDVSFGWVARINWSNADHTGGFKYCGTTKVIPLHAGWNSIVVDLSDPTIMEPTDPCTNPWLAQPWRQQLALRPAEEPDATAFHVGTIKLTAADTITKGQSFPIKLQANMTARTTATFYYNSTRYSTAGRKRAKAYAPILPGPYHTYFPIVGHNMSSGALETIQYNWNTSNVAPGTYYLSVDLNDGYSTTTVYSDAPVVVVP
jgi:hypothetical protein